MVAMPDAEREFTGRGDKKDTMTKLSKIVKKTSILYNSSFISIYDMSLKKKTM